MVKCLPACWRAQSAGVWRWVVPGEALTERTYPSLMEDAVLLLCGYFRFVGPDGGAHGTGGTGGGGGGEAAVEAGSGGWDVEPSLSDRQLSAMLRTLRAAGGLAAGRGADGQTGRLVETAARRTNADGALDEPGGSICPTCVLL